MNMHSYAQVIEFVLAFRERNPDASKQDIVCATAKAFALAKHRSVYSGAGFSLRFSWASGSSFSNVVLSLSALHAFDDKPFIVVVIRPYVTDFLLANSTFLKKISHSSHKLQAENIRGSFLGHDIVRDYEGIPNAPDRFSELFAIHQAFTWSENLERLVDATGNIRGTGHKLCPDSAQEENILRAPELAASLLRDDDYQRIKKEIEAVVADRAPMILRYAEIDNVNIRGNHVEQEITGGINEHGLADVVRRIQDKADLYLEIKSKLLDRASSPKAYNIDKALAQLADGRSLIAFVCVGIDASAELVACSTVSIFDTVVLDATRIQFHWAGRNSRGVTQLTGDITPLFRRGYEERIDTEKAQTFLKSLLAL